MSDIPLDGYWIIVQAGESWIRCDDANMDIVLSGLAHTARYVRIDDLFGCDTFVILDKILNIFTETIDKQAAARAHMRARSHRLDELDPEGMDDVDVTQRPPWERG